VRLLDYWERVRLDASLEPALLRAVERKLSLTVKPSNQPSRCMPGASHTGESRDSRDTNSPGGPDAAWPSDWDPPLANTETGSKGGCAGMDDLIAIERATENEETRVYAWRVEQLARLGLSTVIADAVASFVDWHEVARLVEKGCPPELALEIAR
jgi:hypothetical protein